MLNHVHSNDAGKTAVIRDQVKMIGTPAVTPPAVFSMRGKVAVGVLGSRTLANTGRVAFGFASYRPTESSGSLTIELRKFSANTVIGTLIYSGGFGSANVTLPNAAAVEWATLAAGDSALVAVNACTVPTFDLDVHLIVYMEPPAQVCPLQLGGSGLVSSLDSSVVHAAAEGLTVDSATSDSQSGLRIARRRRCGRPLT